MSSSLLDPEDDKIISDIKARYTYHFTEYQNHLKQAEKYKLMLDVFNGTNSIVAEKNNEMKVVALNEKREKKKTFEMDILDILSDNQPRLVAELLTKYSGISDKAFSTKNFSSKLSISSKHGNIKLATFKDFPVEKRYWWCKSIWFDGDVLKPEYILKIHEKFKNMT